MIFSASEDVPRNWVNDRSFIYIFWWDEILNQNLFRSINTPIPGPGENMKIASCTKPIQCWIPPLPDNLMGENPYTSVSGIAPPLEIFWKLSRYGMNLKFKFISWQWHVWRWRPYKDDEIKHCLLYGLRSREEEGGQRKFCSVTTQSASEGGSKLNSLSFYLYFRERRELWIQQ